MADSNEFLSKVGISVLQKTSNNSSATTTSASTTLNPDKKKTLNEILNDNRKDNTSSSTSNHLSLPLLKDLVQKRKEMTGEAGWRNSSEIKIEDRVLDEIRKKEMQEEEELNNEESSAFISGKSFLSCDAQSSNVHSSHRKYWKL